MVEIRAGLDEGDRVILDPPNDLADGDKVEATTAGGESS